MTIAERIADGYVKHLDMAHLSLLQVRILHAIKSVAVREWARSALAAMKGATK